MERPLKAPTLSLIVPPGPSSTFNTSPSRPHHLARPSPSKKSLIPTPKIDAVQPPKQKRLFPVACRLVSTDQWFTSQVDRTWKVMDLKLWLLSKALPTQILPLPASYRPSSPVTFAAAPPAPPRAASANSYTSHTMSVQQPDGSIPPSPTLAASPTPPPFSASPGSASPTRSVPSSTSSHGFVEADSDDAPFYANSYAAALEDHDDMDSDDDDTRAAPRSIPYSYNTGAPAISGLDALKSNPNKASPGRGYGGGVAGVDMELVRKAEAVARRWRMYSFSTGMLLSDDLPLSEYGIRPYELLEIHRAGAYVRLPRTILPAPKPVSPADAHRPPMTHPAPAQAMARAYHSTTTHTPLAPAHDTQDANSSGLDDAYEDDGTAGSPYAQPYFDGSVWVLYGGGGSGGAAGSGETAPIDGGDTESSGGRRTRRRGRAKSEAAKANKGKDRARSEREWMDLQAQIHLANGAAEPVEENERRDKNPWKKRWLMIREGSLSVWVERRDESSEVCFEVATCVGLYGADKISSIMASIPAGIAPHTASSPLDPTALLTSTSGAAAVSPWSPRTKHVICARFCARRTVPMDRTNTTGVLTTSPPTGTWLIMRLGDETTHEHLLRIIHRLAYSSHVAASRPSTASAAATPALTLPTRTIRTDFLPNPIPHPLSLSFSQPSPLAFSDESPISPVTGSEAGDHGTEWVEDASMWGRPRRRGAGKTPKCIGLGLGMGVRFPEWRETVIRRAIRAGHGVPVEEVGWSAHAGAVDVTTLRGDPDETDVYGFGLDEQSATYLARNGGNDYDSDDADSDAFSEAEWDGWAYDLDRPKVVEGVEGGLGKTGTDVRGGLTTPQGSPVTDSSESERIPDSAPMSRGRIGGVDGFPVGVRPRARSFGTDSPIKTVSSSPSSLSPTSSMTPTLTMPGARLRASTVSAHPRHGAASFSSAEYLGAPLSDETTSTRTVDPGPAAGGVRGLMRGLSMRAGRESFMRGLENALDFVEGK